MIGTSRLSMGAASRRRAHCASAGLAVVILMALAWVRPVSASPLDSIDAAAISVLWPHGESVGLGMNYPQAVIRNLGTTAKNIPAEFKIYSEPGHVIMYDETQAMTLLPGTEQVFPYREVYIIEGTHSAEVTTQLPGDMNPANDVAVDTFSVIGFDRNVGVDAILRPYSHEDTVPFAPIAHVQNYGGVVTEAFIVWFEIRNYVSGVVVYLDSVPVSDLRAGGARAETMPSPWAGHHVANQQYLAKAWTAMPADQHPEDDTAFGMFTVEVMGLAESNPVRDGPQNLSIVPNPSSGRVTVRVAGSNGPAPKDAALTVCDAAGRRLKDIPISVAGYALSRSIDLSGLPNGLYFVRLTTGRQVTETKLILARDAARR